MVPKAFFLNENKTREERTMEHRQDMEEEQFLEEEDVEAFETPGRRRRSEDRGSSPQGRTLIFAVAAAVIIIAFIVIFFGGGDDGVSEDLKSLPTRMDGLEKRLIQVELAGSRIAGVEGDLKAVKQSLRSLEGGVKSLRREIDTLNREFAALSRKTTSALQETSRVPQAEKKAPPEATPRTHTVRRGDTLYSISRKYGTTVDAIRRLNDLTPQEAIQPGQKLRLP
jgi:LysM repeat protein